MTPDAATTGPPSVAPQSGPSRLDAWLAAHGPLEPRAALALALRSCARVAALTDAELSATVASLTPAGVGRTDDGGGWSWAPSGGASPPGALTDAEVVERLGALLFECLTAQPLSGRFVDRQEVSTRLRTLRPGLPSAVTEATALAATSRSRRGASLQAFARDLRAALGVEDRQAAAGRRRKLAGLAVLVGVVTVAATALAWSRRAESAGSHGLTALETTSLDLSLETGDQLAHTGEHTAALQHLRELERMWVSRVALGDPRLAWQSAREAWVRQLAGDRLTAEQILSTGSPLLGAALGERHPYARAAQLQLASVFEARGANEQAMRLRAEAARATAELLRSPALADAWPRGVPWAPYVVAHTAPNAPELEMFRRAPGAAADGYFVPLTSLQRLLAGREGWRLFVRATGSCRAGVVAGAEPRRVEIESRRLEDGDWQVNAAGTTPPLTWREPASPALDLTLAVNPSGAVKISPMGGAAREARIDTDAPTSTPPYALSFDGADAARACAVVWWEVTPPR